MSNLDYPSSKLKYTFKSLHLIKKLFARIFKTNTNFHLNTLTPHTAFRVENNISENYLFNNIISLRNKKAKDIMIPRVDILAFANNAQINDIILQSQVKGYSRLPIFTNNLDNIIGFIHIKDLIFNNKPNTTFNISKILRKVIFISPYMQILNLLYEMRTQKCQLAIVVDEFGGVDGLVTLEDVMEEIVGEIVDEHDTQQQIAIKNIKPYVIEVEARISIEDVEKHIGLFASNNEKEEFDTIGGLIVSLVGYIPSNNEVITHSSGVEFTILQADAIKIKTVLINYNNLLG